MATHNASEDMGRLPYEANTPKTTIKFRVVTNLPLAWFYSNAVLHGDIWLLQLEQGGGLMLTEPYHII